MVDFVELSNKRTKSVRTIEELLLEFVPQTFKLLKPNQQVSSEEISSESYMTPSGETLPGARRPVPLLSMKVTTKIGTWNVRTMYETCKAAQVANEMRRYNIAVLGICESRWNEAGRITLATREQLVYSGHENEQHAHTSTHGGVAFMNTGRFANVSVRQRPVRPRLKSFRQRLMSVRQR